MTQFLRIDSSYPIDKLLPFCNRSINDTRPGADNMSPVGWEENKASFLYLLYGEKRYNGNGNGYIIYVDDGEILCGGGFSRSNIDPHMTHLSSRSYTIPGLILPRIHGQIHDLAIDISIESGQYGAFDSANEYNMRFAEKYSTINDPKNHPGYFMQDGKHYAKPGVRIHPMTPDGPFLINGTKQWITYMIWNEAHRASFLKTLENIRWSD
jgi:hypothetical protein